VRWIKLAISSAFERKLIYSIVSYRMTSSITPSGHGMILPAVKESGSDGDETDRQTESRTNAVT